MAPRIYLDCPLQPDASVTLPPSQARHTQVLRLQPGVELLLFNGAGGEWLARVTRMGRSETEVHVVAHVAVDRELQRAITLAVGMPANERMDTLVEKATELGAAAIQPLLCERSVLRLDAGRAAKRRQHWQGIAIAAAEQSGRTRVPQIAPVQRLGDWLSAQADDASGSAPRRYVLSPRHADSGGLAALRCNQAALLFLSGPEGGLTSDEEALARRGGFVALSLGPRVLRADTAPLAVLAWCGLGQQAG
jgi:16S rRNA (uracil1498-N3)-methyltransferase